MSQSRRKFIKNGLLFVAAASSPIMFSTTFKSKESKETFSQADLLGKGTPKLYGKGFNLRKEAANAFNAMSKAAKADGFKPYVISSYRNYAHQKRIWDRKYVKYTQELKLKPRQAIRKIILYSTIPGTSRHHWGTDLDIVDASKGIVDNPLHERHFNKGGVYHDFKLWLNKNAADFDFYEVYTNTKGRKGFKYEPWHFSYLPTACEMMTEYVNEDLINTLFDSNIKGSQHFDADFVNQYYQENILDINKVLVP